MTCGGAGLKINGTSGYQIVVPSGANEVETRAAMQLQRFLGEMSGAELPVVEEGQYSGDAAIYLGRTEFAKSLNLDIASLKDDGYIYKTVGNDFVIAGGAKKGTLFGMYDMLESLGFRKYTPLATVIPKKHSVDFPNDTVFNPRIVYRTTATGFGGGRRSTLQVDPELNREYNEWHKLSSQREDWGMFVHTFIRNLVKPEEHFAAHPEYYALRNGQRLPTQLCLSNPDVLRICIEDLRELIARNPEAKYWSVSQEDNAQTCQCPSCLALNKKYGGHESRESGAMLWFTNQVAKAFPDKMISTLAYWYTLNAPDNIIAEPNVNIMLCNIDSHRHRPIFEADTAFTRHITNWGRIAKDIIIWDYNIQFSNMVSPFPNLHVIGPNLDFFNENNVNAFYMQSSSTYGGEMAELRPYLISKMMWDPKADWEAMIEDFCNGYWGKAGPYVLEYINTMRQSLLDSGFRLSIFGSPEQARDSYLSAEMMQEYSRLFDEAEKAVQNDPVMLDRVKITRLPIQYAQIQISRGSVDEPRSLYKHDENGELYIDPVIPETVDKFIAGITKAGMGQLREREIPIRDYKAAYDRIFDKTEDTRSALSVGKKITPVSEFSRRHQAPETLTDGMFASAENWRDCRYDNWVGVNGTHMTFIVDLDTLRRVKYINMDFLNARDTYYEMNLPKYVSYSFSTDGVNFGDEFRVVAPIDPMAPEFDNMPRDIYIQPFTAYTGRTARYIKVHAESVLRQPNWHVRAGSPVTMFADEIVVK